MNIWTCGSSPRSGSRNAWMRIKNVNGASLLSYVWNFFGAIGDHGRNLVISLWAGDKAKSMEWRHSVSPRPKKFGVQKSAGKVLTSIFWDHDGILLIDYLPKGQTINSSLLVHLKNILKEKRHGKITEVVLFLHDNALAHRALATVKELDYLGFQCLDHPPYSPDLARSDYHLFPGLKKTIERSPFFVRRGGHYCRRDLVGRTTFWIFFEWLQKLQ